MLTIAYYFLQVVLCSGMLMGYYWLVLRNKRFHQYNRFYLLAAALLSWIVPLIKISWNPPVLQNENPQVISLLSAVAYNNSQIEATLTGRSLWNWDLLAAVVYFSVAAILLIAMLQAFVRLYRLLKTNSCKSVGDVFLILTQAKGTPFSFFRYIFWNEEIDIRSEAGQQILQHELAHVKQKHSFDKILIQLMLVGGWFNPFFWLLKSEMEMIHEFIADKKAVNNGDTAALAQMLLTAAYPQQQFALTHPFFFSPIKRRLLMLTNHKNPRFSYIRRLVVLPLFGIVVVLFAFRSQEARAAGELSVAAVVENYKDELTDVFVPGDPVKETQASILINGKRFAAETVSLKDLKFGPYALGLPDEKQINTDPATLASSVYRSRNTDPVFVINGERWSREQLNALDPSYIESISVFKNKDAVAAYGADAANGVIDIKLKAGYTLTNSGIIASDTRFSLVNFTVVAKDRFNNIARNRKVFVRQIIYQGEEKKRIFEEVIEAASDNDGMVVIHSGSGTKAVGFNDFTQLDLSHGPYYSNVKLAIAPSVQTAGWTPAENYVDLGLSQLTIRDNNPMQSPRVNPVFSGQITSVSNGRSTTLKTGPDGEITWTTVPNISMGTSTHDTLPGNGQKTGSNEKETVLNEVTVAGYPTAEAMIASQGKKSAQFPGGKEGWEKYLMRNLNSGVLKENKGAPGRYTVTVSFVVDEKGNISDVKAINDPGYGTKDEAERIIKKGPRWVPATDENGQYIRSTQKQPINFIYVDDSKTKTADLPAAALERVVVTDPAQTQLMNDIRDIPLNGLHNVEVKARSMHPVPGSETHTSPMQGRLKGGTFRETFQGTVGQGDTITPVKKKSGKINSTTGQRISLLPQVETQVIVRMPGIRQGDPFVGVATHPTADWTIESVAAVDESRVSVRFKNHTLRKLDLTTNDYKVLQVR